MKMSLRSKVVIYALLVMVAIYFLSPFVYMLFSTFKTSAEAIAYPPSLFPKARCLNESATPVRLEIA